MNAIRRFAVVAVLAVPLFAQTPPAAPAREVWTVDTPHSTVSFKIRHLMSSVTGNFRDFNAVLEIDRAQPARSSVEFTIKAASIDTRDADRDEHLRSPDFFEAAKYPNITFKSTSITPKSKESFDVTGDFTMHGVTKRITFPVSYLGQTADARGIQTAGFEMETTLDRKEYNVSWNRVLDEGGVLLGDEVKVTIDLEMKRKE